MKPDMPPPEMPRKPAPPPALAAFLAAVRPAGKTPAQDMLKQFQEARAANAIRGMILPSPPKDSTAYFVELRIREWELRQKRDAAERQKHEDLAASKPKPPKNTP